MKNVCRNIVNFVYFHDQLEVSLFWSPRFQNNFTSRTYKNQKRIELLFIKNFHRKRPNCNDPKSKIPERRTPSAKKGQNLYGFDYHKRKISERQAPIFGEQTNFWVNHYSWGKSITAVLRSIVLVL
jgi:hypothetical protein